MSMSKLVWSSPVALFLAGVMLFACTVKDAADNSAANEGSGGSWSHGTSTTTGTTGSGYGYGGGGGAGSGLPIDPIAPPPVDDPPEVTCASLDPTQPLVLYLSADDSNSMGAPALAREVLSHSGTPVFIRTHEFLNYYSFDYPAPAAGQLALFAQTRPGDQPENLDMQIALRSGALAVPRPKTVTLVLDTSGSMSGPGIERERAVVLAIAQSLKSGDIVNAVTWNTDNNVVLSGHQVSGPNDPTVVQLANNLTASGGTDLHSGLVSGYQLAQAHFGNDRLNRVVLISDGGANVGVTDADLIGQHSEDADAEGIYLVGVGTGPAGVYSDALMDVVTDAGRGAYVYIDTPQEAQRMFVNHFDEVMEIAARAVQIEFTVPWYFQMLHFYGEEYSTDPEQVDPQHLAPNDAMVFHQVLRACDAQVINPSDPVTIHASWQAPDTYAPMEMTLTLTLGQMLAADASQLEKGRAIVAYAEALRSGTHADLASALDRVNAANSGQNDPDLDEIAGLIVKHPAY